MRFFVVAILFAVVAFATAPITVNAKTVGSGGGGSSSERDSGYKAPTEDVEEGTSSSSFGLAGTYTNIFRSLDGSQKVLTLSEMYMRFVPIEDYPTYYMFYQCWRRLNSDNGQPDSDWIKEYGGTVVYEDGDDAMKFQIAGATSDVDDAEQAGGTVIRTSTLNGMFDKTNGYLKMWMAHPGTGVVSLLEPISTDGTLDDDACPVND